MIVEQKMTIECSVVSQLAKAEECQKEYQYRTHTQSIMNVMNKSPIILIFSFYGPMVDQKGSGQKAIQDHEPT